MFINAKKLNIHKMVYKSCLDISDRNESKYELFVVEMKCCLISWTT